MAGGAATTMLHLTGLGSADRHEGAAVPVGAAQVMRIRRQHAIDHLVLDGVEAPCAAASRAPKPAAVADPSGK